MNNLFEIGNNEHTGMCIFIKNNQKVIEAITLDRLQLSQCWSIISKNQYYQMYKLRNSTRVQRHMHRYYSTILGVHVMCLFNHINYNLQKRLQSILFKIDTYPSLVHSSEFITPSTSIKIQMSYGGADYLFSGVHLART